MSGTRLSSTATGAAAILEREAAPVLDALISDGHTALIPVRGHSMRPLLVQGDLAVVAPFLGLPRPGQIVLSRGSGNGLAVHRLIGIEMRSGRRLYRLQGDAEPEPDPGVLREDMLGRVIALVRNGQRLEIDEPA